MAVVFERLDTPHGRAFYSARAVIALLAGTAFMWGVFRSESYPVPSRLFGVFLVIAFYLGAWQSIERLLRPEKARERTAAISDSARYRLRFYSKATVLLYYIGLGVTSAMRLIDAKHTRSLAIDVFIFCGALLIIGSCVADLNGQRLFYPYRQKWP